MPSMTTEPRLTEQFDEALAYAAELHRNQTRKGGDIPYLGHLLSVASLVIEAGGSQTQAIAALLHDAAEDRAANRHCRDRRRFGSDVAEIVEAVQRHVRGGPNADGGAERAYIEDLKRGLGGHDPGLTGGQAGQRAGDAA